MQLCGHRPSIDGSDLHQDVFGTSLGIFHKDIEILIVIENARVEEFILHIVSVAIAVSLNRSAYG